ncbi:dedicator of cytokinesis protein 7-like, partial [Trifolium medium]|nr:dedicator of cytokinesis protein 7-like [Trifolium medium]
APVMTMDRYAAAESFYKLAMAFAPVPDLHIMWLLHLCDAHQEMQSWAEAAQCAVAVAGVVMQINCNVSVIYNIEVFIYSVCILIEHRVSMHVMTQSLGPIHTSTGSKRL